MSPWKTLTALRIVPKVSWARIAVHGHMVTQTYFKREASTRLAKIRDADGNVWHRMGDLGYFDASGRLWFCGRKSHRVQLTPDTTLYTTQVEALFNTHPDVFEPLWWDWGKPHQKPALCVELEKKTTQPWPQIEAALRDTARQHAKAQAIEHFLVHPGFPVDIRHNAKSAGHSWRSGPKGKPNEFSHGRRRVLGRLVTKTIA